jgi:hypothetical protein
MTLRPEQAPVSLYVDRSLPSCWIVRDRDGAFWMVPAGDKAWEQRQPYTLTVDAQLESVPGHYKYLLGIAG